MEDVLFMGMPVSVEFIYNLPSWTKVVFGTI